MPCYYGHPAPDEPDLHSLSRRDILGISGLSALAVAGGGLLLSNCNGETTSEPTSEDYKSTFGVLALFPPTVTTMAEARDAANKLEDGKCYIHIPYYNDTNLNGLKKEDIVSCRILFIGGDMENPFAAIAVNLRRDEAHTHAAYPEDVMKKRETVTAALKALGYERLFLTTRNKTCP